MDGLGVKEELVMEKEEVVFLSKLEDHQLSEKVERLRKQITSPLALKLTDKGEKCRRSLKICEDELEKRNQLRPKQIVFEYPQKDECESSNQSPQKAENESSNLSSQKGVNEKSNLSSQRAGCDNSKQLSQKAECGNSKQSQDSIACNDCSSEAPPSQTCSRTKVNSLLQEPVENENLSPHTSVNPFHTELPVLQHENHPNSSSGVQLLKRRWEHWQHENEHNYSVGADADEYPRFNRRFQSENGHRSPLGAQYADYPRFNRQRPHAYYPRHPFKRHIQREPAIPTLQKILGDLFEKPTTPRPHYQPHFRAPAESQMMELICTMEQQLETLHTQLAGIESQVTTRMDRLEAKLEQIFQVRTGNSSTMDATSEGHNAKSAS